MNKSTLSILLVSICTTILLAGCHRHDDSHDTKNSQTAASAPSASNAPETSSHSDTEQQPSQKQPASSGNQPPAKPGNSQPIDKSPSGTHPQKHLHKNDKHGNEEKSKPDACARSNWTRVTCKNGDNACIAHQIDLMGQYERCKREGKLHK